MAQLDHRPGPDSTDLESAEMAGILIRGSAVGIPVVFAIAVVLVFAAGVRGFGALFIAAWAGLIGGTFIGSSIMLAKRLGALGSLQHTSQPDPASGEAASLP